MNWENDEERVERWNAQYGATPLRRCDECHKNLDTEHTVAYAFGGCPLFGYRRQGVEIRCHFYEPKRNR